MITSLSELDLDKKYSYADYILWQFQERVELLKGRLFPMAAPNVKHQSISMNLTLKIGRYLEKENCRLFSAPFDVRLPLPSDKVVGDKIETVVQPDLCVVCDENKLDKQGCIGAPDLVVEILSPGNSKREMKDKFELYEEAGVLEYWVVAPEHQFVMVYHLNAKTQKFELSLPVLTNEDVLRSVTFEGMEIEVGAVFR